MSLLEKLREDRASALETIEGLENEIAPLEQAREFWTQMVADYDIAIAALEPPAAETQESPAAEVEIPEGFTKWDGAFTPLGPGLFVQVMYRDGEINGPYPSDEVFAYWVGDESDDDVIAYRIAEAPAQPEPDDEPAEHISILTGDPAVEPESGLHGEPVPQPEWNEPEGYAPVTNPDAEAQAKALDYYSPERVAERNRFNPFAVFKREETGL